MQEMRTAEASSSFDYDPNWTPSSGVAQQIFVGEQDLKLNIGIPSAAAEISTSPPIVKRKNSLDDFELEIDGMNLDDNIDTSVSIRCWHL